MSTFMKQYTECKADGHTAMYCLRACMKAKPIPKPNSTRALVHSATGCANHDIKTGDASFDPIDVIDMRTFLKQDKTDLEVYKKDIFDCENFALRLHERAHEYFRQKGLNAEFGELWGDTKIGSHALNCFGTPERVLYLIEPQSDEIFTVRDYLRGAPYWVVIS